MTDPELLDLYYQAQSVAIGVNAFYLSLLSGYLITAHVVGERLSSAQVAFISLSYFVFQSISVIGMYQYMMSGIQLLGMATAIPPILEGQLLSLTSIHAYTAFMFICLLGSLIYMYAVRRPTSS